MDNFSKSSLFDMLDINPEVLSTEADDNKYTKVVNIPQYLPKNAKPNVKALFNDEKFRSLREDIMKCTSISEDERTFLLTAATRHIIFNYAMIADYYAHSGKEMQELMEKSALVIIDMNDAIANGYVALSKTINEIMDSSGVVSDEE